MESPNEKNTRQIAVDLLPTSHCSGFQFLFGREFQNTRRPNQLAWPNHPEKLESGCAKKQHPKRVHHLARLPPHLLPYQQSLRQCGHYPIRVRGCSSRLFRREKQFHCI